MEYDAFDHWHSRENLFVTLFLIPPFKQGFLSRLTYTEIFAHLHIRGF